MCCPRRVSLCRMQLPEARFGPSLRRGLGAERPSWLRVHGCGLGAEGLCAPNPASPRRRTRGQCDSGAGNPQQSSRSQGSRRSPAPHRPMESAGPGGKTACTAFLSQCALGVWFAAQGEFPFAECSSQKLFLGRRCHGSSALIGRAGSGGKAGAMAQKPFANPILLAHEGEPVWSVFGRRKLPAKQQGPGIQGQPSPALRYGERRAGVKTTCVDYLRRGTVRLWFAAGGEFPFAECSSQKLVMCLRCDGASALSGRAGSGGMAGTWAQKPFAHPILHSPRRRIRGEWDLGAGDPQQSSRAQGARGGPAPLCPMERGGPGAQTACVDFLRQGTVRLWIAAGGEFPFAE